MSSTTRNTRLVSISLALLIAAFNGGCSSDPNGPSDVLTYTFDFDRGPQGFVAGFADYPPANEAIFKLTSDHRQLPSPLDSNSALYISGVNRSDDLFMFFKGTIEGLSPGQNYRVTVSLEIATDTPAGCVGVGGAPGESVRVKAGVTATEPVAVLRGTYLRMNINIGNQSSGSDQVVVLGNVANSRSCEQSRRWERKAFTDRLIPAPFSTPPDGRAWLCFGVDSGFESGTEIYFTSASVTFTPM